VYGDGFKYRKIPIGFAMAAWYSGIVSAYGDGNVWVVRSNPARVNGDSFREKVILALPWRRGLVESSAPKEKIFELMGREIESRQGEW
jgi:hypothetical protein